MKTMFLISPSKSFQLFFQFEPGGLLLWGRKKPRTKTLLISFYSQSWLSWPLRERGDLQARLSGERMMSESQSTTSSTELVHQITGPTVWHLGGGKPTPTARWREIRGNRWDICVLFSYLRSKEKSVFDLRKCLKHKDFCPTSCGGHGGNRVKV